MSSLAEDYKGLLVKFPDLENILETSRFNTTIVH